MRKELFTSFCALSLVLGASHAIAGSYGDQGQAMEGPAAPPPVAPMVETEEVDYARSGAYLGVGGVFAFELFDDSIDVDNSNGFHVRAGYRIIPNLAVEARYENYRNFETDPGPGHYEGWSVTGNAKGYILTGRWQPYALVGLGYLNMVYPGTNRAGGASPGDDFMMRFGIGMDANITEHIAIGPEVAYVLPFGDVDDLDMLTVSLGVQYKF
jgi:opacity protein-like surface antigen